MCIFLWEEAEFMIPYADVKIIIRGMISFFLTNKGWNFLDFCVCLHIMFFPAAGGFSIGCPENAGAAGTHFNAYLSSLRVSNDNLVTETETPLLDFSTSPLWSNVFVENNAKVLVPLLWTRVQVA